MLKSSSSINQATQQGKPNYNPEDLNYLVHKYRSKKRGYKESLRQLRNDLKLLLEDKYKHEDKLKSQDKLFQQEKRKLEEEKAELLNQLQASAPPSQLNSSQLHQNQQHFDQLAKECEHYKQLSQQLQLENTKLRTQLYGKTEECVALHQEVSYYQNRLHQMNMIKY